MIIEKDSPEERLQQINLFDEQDEVFLQEFKDGTATCTYCKKELPVSAFSEGARYSKYVVKARRSACKNCTNKHTAIIEQLALENLPKPDHCQCCKVKAVKVLNRKKYSNKGSLQLDHTHGENPVFRGWICVYCNSGFGKFNDDLKGILVGALYLAKNDVDLILKTIKNI